MADRLPSGRWRGRVRDPRTGKQVTPSSVIGGPRSYATRREAERAEDVARDALIDIVERGKTVREFWDEWTSSDLWARPAESTNRHNAERTRAFAERFAERPIASIGAADVAAYLDGGRNRGTVPALRAMFNDARRPQAGMLVTTNPFANLGLRTTRGRKDVQPPDQVATARMLAAADELTPPSFAAYLETACFSAARPGELDALRWDDVDLDRETIRIERQWNAKLGKLTLPKHDSRRTIALTEPVRRRLQVLPRESEWLFTTLRGTHYTPSSRVFHWNRVRASVGLGNVALYTATRHYFGWYALNVLELAPHVIALQLGHDDGGQLVRELYGHPDAAIARELTRVAFRSIAPVSTLPIARATSGS
jgi:integrase